MDDDEELRQLRVEMSSITATQNSYVMQQRQTSDQSTGGGQSLFNGWGEGFGRVADSFGNFGNDEVANTEDIQVANSDGRESGSYVPNDGMSLFSAHKYTCEKEAEERSKNRLSDDMLHHFLQNYIRKSSQNQEQEYTPQTSETRKRSRNDVERNAIRRMYGDALIQPSEVDGETGHGIVPRKRRRRTQDSSVVDSVLGAVNNTENSMSESESASSQEVYESSDTESHASRGSNRKMEELRQLIQIMGDDREKFLQEFCPLCGFADNSQDGISSRRWMDLKNIIETYVGCCEEWTHARLVAMYWNQFIFLPMEKMGKRINKLQVSMAHDHIYEPHRKNSRFILYKLRSDLVQTCDTLKNNIFSKHPLTGRVQADHKTFNDYMKASSALYTMVKDPNKDPLNNDTTNDQTATTAGAGINPNQMLSIE